MSDLAPSETVFEALAPYLGPHTARTAVRTFSTRALGIAPEAVTWKDAPKLIAALKPTLGALLGTAKAQEVLEGLERKLKE